MKQNVSTWSSLQPLGLVHPWWSYIKKELGLFCQMQEYLWNSMFNPLCQAIYLFSAKCISDYFSVCYFFKIQNYTVALKQKEGGMKMSNLKVYLVKAKLGKALSISGAG